MSKLLAQAHFFGENHIVKFEFLTGVFSSTSVFLFMGTRSTKHQEKKKKREKKKKVKKKKSENPLPFLYASIVARCISF